VKNTQFVVGAGVHISCDKLPLRRGCYSQKGVCVPFCEHFCQKSVPGGVQLLAQFVGTFLIIVRFEATNLKLEGSTRVGPFPIRFGGNDEELDFNSESRS